MAGRGPVPAPDGQRRRRNATPDTTVLPADGHTGPSPDLPPKGGRQRWLGRTLAWYELWRAAPQAATFGVTDWAHLHETAYIADEFFRGELRLAGELRLRLAKLGATPEDRMRLRMAYGLPEVGAGAPARPALDPARRRRLRALGDEQAGDGTAGP